MQHEKNTISHSQTAINKLHFTVFECFLLLFLFYRNAIHKVAEILMVPFIASRLHTNIPC